MDTDTIRVLLVDDDEDAFEITRAMISQIDTPEIELDWSRSFEEGLAALESEAYDLGLIDYFLEERTGMELLRAARARGIRKPLVMLTGRGSRQVDVEAMKAGASDYLVKDEVDPEHLERSIRYALERHRAEEALRSSEARQRAMFDHLPIGLHRTTREGTFVDANPALVRLLGHPDREILERRYARHFYVNPDDRDRFWERLRTEGVVRGFESRVERVDGVPVLLRSTARLHRSSGGEIAYVEGSVENVAERPGADLGRGGDEAFRAIFEEAELGIAVVDHDGLIVETNPAFRAVFGFDREALRDASFVDLADEEDQGAVLRAFGTLRSATEERSEGDWRWRAEDGTRLWARTTMVDPRGAPPPSEENGEGRILVLFRDVSEDG